MAYLDERMVASIAEFPHKKGSYEIENYIFGGDGVVRPGCWLLGDTVVGDISLGADKYEAFSVPVLAYLSHVNTVRVPTKVKQAEEVSLVRGFSTAFSLGAEIEVKLGASFLLSAETGIKLSANSTESIHGSSSITRKIEIEGPGVFNIYQLHVVYAHSVIGGGALAEKFKCSRVRGNGPNQQLFFLTSIATHTNFTTSRTDSVAPLGWEEIQKAVLMNAYDPEFNSGKWAIYYGARK